MCAHIFIYTYIPVKSLKAMYFKERKKDYIAGVGQMKRNGEIM